MHESGFFGGHSAFVWLASNYQTVDLRCTSVYSITCQKVLLVIQILFRILSIWLYIFIFIWLHLHIHWRLCTLQTMPNMYITAKQDIYFIDVLFEWQIIWWANVRQHEKENWDVGWLVSIKQQYGQGHSCLYNKYTIFHYSIF